MEPQARRFVGREAELSRLEAALARAMTGRGRLVLISGEPGIGKTRLAAELGLRAAAAGARTLWGRCWDDGGAPAYWPWTQVLRAHAAATPSDPPAAAGASVDGLAPLLPELAGDAVAPAEGSLVERRFRLFDSTALFLRRASAETPLVLLFDDMHASDESSLLLLRFCAAELETMPVLILCTYREVEVRLQRPLAARFAELARAGERIALSGWDATGVGEFLAGLAAPPISEPQVAAIRQITDGNPFFVDEIAREMLAGRLTPAALLESGPLSVPDGVRETVRRRLAMLPDRAIRLLEIASIIGREFDAPLLRSVLAARDGEETPTLPEMIALLDLAVAAGMLLEPPAGAVRYAFVHALIRETLRNDVPAGQRMAAHRIVGEVMESRDGEAGYAAAEIAHHFLQGAAAGGAGKAVLHSRRAADEAFGRSAYEAAATHYQRALDALQFEPVEEALRCELLLALGLAEHVAGRIPVAGEVFRRAATLARRIGQPRFEARAALGYGRIGESGAVDRTLVELLEGALGVLDDADVGLRARLMARLAMALYFSTDPADGARYVELSAQALAMARGAGDATTLGAALVARHFVLWGPQGSAERMSLSAELAELAARSGHRELALEAHVWRAIDLLERGDGTGFRVEVEALGRGAEASLLPLYRWYHAVLDATGAIARSEMEEAMLAAGRARDLAERYHISRGALFFDSQMFVLLRHQGRLAELEPALRSYVERFPALPVWRAALASALTESGRLDEAAATVAAVMASDPDAWPCDGNWLPSLALLSEASAALGDATTASRLRELLAPHAGTFIIIFDGGGVLGPVDDFLGLLAAALGEHAAAARHRARAASLRDALGARSTAQPAERARPAGGKQRRFRCDGDFWTIGFGGTESRLKHSRGLFYLASLLGRPGEDLHAVELASLAPGNVVRAVEPSADLPRRSRAALDGGDELIDGRAKLAYRQRLRDLQEELAEAEDHNDVGRAEALNTEMQSITDELSRSLGLGGRSRQTASQSERARIAVTKAILLAVRAIGRHNPALQRFLGRTIRTGQFCGYHPEPEEAGWELGS